MPTLLAFQQTEPPSHAAQVNGWVAAYQRNADAKAPAGGASASVGVISPVAAVAAGNGARQRPACCCSQRPWA